MSRNSLVGVALAAAAVLATALGACSAQKADAPADIVFFGEHIMTVEPGSSGATAVAVRGDTIVAVGEPIDVEGMIGKETRVVELGDRALLPGFIDAHGHLGMTMQMLDFLNASSPPVGPMETIDDIVVALRERIAESGAKPGEFVMGYGYDDSLLAEGRHPDRDDLDRASLDRPILLLHVSAHLATANSAALALFGIDADTPDPSGGIIRRRPGSREPNGVLEEAAAVGPLLQQFAASASPEIFAANLLRAIAYYASSGITTIQDGASTRQLVGGLRAVAAQRPLDADVAAFLLEREVAEGSDLETIGFTSDYQDGVRVAGVKFVLDGSPQGRTAWLTSPYVAGPPGAAADYVAYPTMDPDRYRSLSKELMAGGIPLLAHANGDAAIDLMLEGVAGGVAAATEPLDHRSVAIHAQLARPDQLDEMKRLGVVPSFFAAHPFFWGDWHRESFGDERALRISPLHSAIERELTFTIHNDAPVVPPDMLRLLEIAVERRTRSGFVLGEDERVTVEEAIRAITLDAAYAYFEEDRKGSIAVGKQADLVVLGADPRRVPTSEIAAIPVLETLARGRTIYSASAPTVASSAEGEAAAAGASH
jgi:hypothetical protein